MHAAAASVGDVEAIGEAPGAGIGALTIIPRRRRGRRRGWRRPWAHEALLGHSRHLACREEMSERAAWPRSEGGINIQRVRIKWDRRKRYGVADARPLHADAGCRKSSALMLSIIIAASGCAEREDMALRLLSMMALRPLSMRAKTSGLIAAAPGCRAT